MMRYRSHIGQQDTIPASGVAFELPRRAVLAALPFALFVGPALAAKPKEIVRVSGTVTPRNYKGLETFLLNSIDKLIGLKLRFDANEDAGRNEVAAYVEDGLFLAYLREEESESQITAKDSVASFQHGGYVLDGFFVVKYGGMNQGIQALVLEPSDEGAVLASGVRVKDIDIGRLKAGKA